MMNRASTQTNQITCPHCHSAFTVDENAYIQIVQQIRESELNALKGEILDTASREKDQAVLIAKHEVKTLMQQTEIRLQKKVIELESMLENADSTKKLALEEAKCINDKERYELISKIEQQKKDFAQQLELNNRDHKHAIFKETSDLKNQKEKLVNQLKEKDQQYLIAKTGLKEKYESMLMDRDDVIERLKDFKQRLSTKMIGETAEDHIKMSFDSIRTTAYPNSYFEKDNTISPSGSKGDFIFKNKTDDNEIILSAMIEVKNECDTTETKKKNADFLKKLDRDRSDKNCEYAILVSLLEMDSDYYNQGIVEVYNFQKMFVVRPQQFLPLIAILNNIGMDKLESKRELARIKEERLDVSTFYNNLNSFKSSIKTNTDRYHKNFIDVIKWIENTIRDLTKVKESLIKMDDNLRIANDKVQGLTIRKLTTNSPSISRLFKNIDEQSNNNLPEALSIED